MNLEEVQEYLLSRMAIYAILILMMGIGASMLIGWARSVEPVAFNYSAITKGHED